MKTDALDVCQHFKGNEQLLLNRIHRLEEAIEKSRERKDRLLRNRVLHLAKFACFVGCFGVLFEWVWSLFDWSIGRGEPGPERDKLKAREYKVVKMDVDFIF